ncbi:glycerol-3-phosphate acyltransferase [Chloroflexota bacterium]
MIALLVVICYLIGSIPVAWLTAKLVTGEDLRQSGSGNVGVMNTALSVARWAGLLVLMAEAAKGAAAVLLARAWGADQVAMGLAVLATVAGTRWSIWLRGAGGRGNTTGFTAILLLSWPTFVGSLGIWCLARVVTRRSFVATRIFLVTWPFLFGLLTQSWWNVAFGAVLSLMYLSTQDPETDDHLLIKERWPNLWEFLTGPPRG